MLEPISLTAIFALVLGVTVGCTGWRRYPNCPTIQIPTLFKVFAIIIIVGLFMMPLTSNKSHTLDLRIIASPHGSGGILCTFKWPKGINLTKDDKYRIGRRLREIKKRTLKDQPFDLTTLSITELFLKQNGRCGFSGKAMTWTPNNLATVAITKIDPDKPPVIGNIILCCKIVATMKNSYSYETLLKRCAAVVRHAPSLRDSRILSHEDIDNHLAVREKWIGFNAIITDETIEESKRNKITRKPRTDNSMVRKERAMYGAWASECSVKICSHCEEYLPLDLFAKRTKNNPGPDGLESACKFCMRKQGLKSLMGIRPFLVKKVRSCLKRARKKGEVCDLTVEMVLAQFDNQEGLCFYSGVSMTGEPGNLDNVSIDRIDSCKPYISSNIVLCCEAINILKNAMDYPTLLDYCEAIVENALPLDDTGLLERPNESQGAKRRQAALERDLKRDTGLRGMTIVRHGNAGFSIGNPLPEED